MMNDTQVDTALTSDKAEIENGEEGGEKRLAAVCDRC